MPAVKDNANALKSGVHAYLRLGKLPAKCGYVRRLLNSFRDQLEAETVAKTGAITFYQRLRISAAMRHEGRYQLLSRWLAVEGADLSVSDRIALVRELGNATEARDKAVRELGIDATGRTDPWAALDAQSKPAAAASASQANHQPHNSGDAADAKLGPSESNPPEPQLEPAQ